MRIVTLNANGIRSAASKGLFEWLPRQKADVLCIQETKAQPEDLKEAPLYFPKGWHVRLNSARKKGYAGVAIYARQEPDEVLESLGVPEFDDENYDNYVHQLDEFFAAQSPLGKTGLLATSDAAPGEAPTTPACPAP